jgi:hypothetical protein
MSSDNASDTDQTETNTGTAEAETSSTETTGSEPVAGTEQPPAEQEPEAGSPS